MGLQAAQLAVQQHVHRALAPKIASQGWIENLDELERVARPLHFKPHVRPGMFWCSTPLRAGTHELTVEILRQSPCGGTYFGVASERQSDSCDPFEFACAYYCDRNGDGIIKPEGAWVNWKGQQGATTDDTIGLMLDMDRGDLKVFKNGEYLGVIFTGLAGQVLHWYVDHERSSGKSHNARIEISSPAGPASRGTVFEGVSTRLAGPPWTDGWPSDEDEDDEDLVVFDEDEEDEYSGDSEEADFM